MTNQVISYIKYSESEAELDRAQNILGFAVYDRDGEHIGAVDEILLDGSDSGPQRDNTPRPLLAIVSTGGVLGHEQIAVPFEAFAQPDQTRREVRVNYPREFFEHDWMAFRGLNALDQDATGRLYGLYEMDNEWFDERRGADPEGVKYG